MFDNENDFFAALGLEAPAEGEKEQEPADPAEVETADEEPVTEDADEPNEDEPADAEGEEEREDDADPADGEPREQSEDERRRNAARRRQAERDAAIRAAVDQALAQERQRHDEEIKAAFAKAGFKDGDKPIESVAQLGEYLQRQELEQMERDLKSGKLTPEGLRSVIAAEVTRQTPVQPQPQPDNAAFMAQVEAELREIQRYAPEIRTPADLMNLDRRDAFVDAVRNHNHTFAEAYRFVYADKIAEQAAKKAAQRTRNNDRGKQHMRPTGAAGTGDVTVPAEVERNIRAIMPRATPKDIRSYYQKYVKQTGG